MPKLRSVQPLLPLVTKEAEWCDHHRAACLCLELLCRLVPLALNVIHVEIEPVLVAQPLCLRDAIFLFYSEVKQNALHVRW